MQIENSLIGGRYRLGKKIGQGGFAQVFLAVDTVLERQVAVKILNSDLTDEKDFLERFGREARAIAALDHPNILGIYDFGQLTDTAFIVMPFVEGGSLHEKLRRDGRFSPPQAGYFLAQAAAALDYAHRRNLVHRDVKPQNMLLRSEDDRLLLTDFGISKILSSASAQSRTGIMGTLSYMSPEQLGGNVGRGTDIYALGCVLFQMLTGQLPYSGPTEQVIMGHMMQPIPSIVERSQGQLATAFQGIIEKALAKKVEDRYHSAGEMAQGFYAVLNGSPYPVSQFAPFSNPNPLQSPTQPYNQPRQSSPGLPVTQAPTNQPQINPVAANPAPAVASQSYQTEVAPKPRPTPALSQQNTGNYDPTQVSGQTPARTIEQPQVTGKTASGASEKTEVANQPPVGNYDATQVHGQQSGTARDKAQVVAQSKATSTINEPSVAKSEVLSSSKIEDSEKKATSKTLGLPWWLWWGLSSFLGLPVTWLLAFLTLPLHLASFRTQPAYWIGAFLGGLVGGIVVGTGQWLGLRSILPVSKQWIVSTALSWAIAHTIFLYPISTNITSTVVEDLLFFALAGLVMGLGQWWLLRRHLTQANLWILINLIILLIVFFLVNRFDHRSYYYLVTEFTYGGYEVFFYGFTRVTLFLLIAGATYGMMTTLAMMFLSRNKLLP